MTTGRSHAIDFATFFANAKFIRTSAQNACHKNLFSLMVHRREHRGNPFFAGTPRTPNGRKSGGLSNSPLC
jgi:hypothetical protein